MAIRVVNMKHYRRKSNEVLMRVDRATVVGNPYVLRDESMRDDVCERYEEYFKRNVQRGVNPQFRDYVVKLFKTAQTQDLALGCWCAPKRCHAETIKRFLDDALQKDGGIQND